MKRLFLIFALVALLPVCAWGEEINPSMNTVNGEWNIYGSGITLWASSGNSKFSVDGAGNVNLQGYINRNYAGPYYSITFEGLPVATKAFRFYQSDTNYVVGLMSNSSGSNAVIGLDGVGGVNQDHASVFGNISPNADTIIVYGTNYTLPAARQIARFDTSERGLLIGDGLIAHSGVSLDVQGMGSFTGVSVGNVTLPTVPSGLTSFVAIGNLPTEPDAPANGTLLYSYQGEGYWIDASGTSTQQTPHDPATGEFYLASRNTYTGKTTVIRIQKLLEDVKAGAVTEISQLGAYLEVSQGPKANPEFAAKERWIAKHMAETSIIIPEAQAFETVTVEEDITTTEMEEEKVTYAIENGKVKQNRIKVKVPVKGKVSKQVARLRAGHVLDSETGLIHRRPTRAEAEAAAVTGFVFDWATMPKFVRQAWGK